MHDWEAYKLISELIEKLDHSAPADYTMDAADGWFEAARDAEKKLREARDPYKDRLYTEYMAHDQKPWCDTCGGPVAAYASGWEHYQGSDPWFGPHEITTKEYHFGSEALVEKRLKFEIEH